MTDELVEEVTNAFILAKDGSLADYVDLVKHLQDYYRKAYLESLVHFLEKHKPHVDKMGSRSKQENGAEQKEIPISGGSALMSALLTNIPPLTETVSEWLIKNNTSIDIQRTCIAALSEQARLKILRATLELFGDKLYIKHTPMIRQEVITRLLLLCAGYVHRSDRKHLQELARSSVHTRAISARLRSSSARLRWLGMVVGTAISGLVDEDDKKINFDMEELKTAEAMSFIGLVHVEDRVGSIKDMHTPQKKELSISVQGTKPIRRGLDRPPTKSKIIEVVDESDEDDLIPYAKPDSDPEDEDEDATLVERNKPKAPSYVVCTYGVSLLIIQGMFETSLQVFKTPKTIWYSFLLCRLRQDLSVAKPTLGQS